MKTVSHSNSIVAVGWLSIAIAVERFVNAMLVDGIANYASMPFVVAAICGTVGIALLTVSAVIAWGPLRSARRRRPSREG